KVTFSENELAALARTRELLRAGLLDAASDELSVFSTRPLSVDESQYLVNFYAQALHYQKGFALANTAFDDKAEDRRSDFLLRQIFPKEFWNLVNDDGRRSQLDPFLLLAVMKQESAFDPDAISRSGAVGLLQMIPPTAEDVKKELKADTEIPKGLQDPATNV